LITHDPDYILSDLLTTPQGRLTDVKLGQEVHREHNFHSVHCVYNSMFKVITRLLTFSHILYWKNFGNHLVTVL